MTPPSLFFRLLFVLFWVTMTLSLSVQPTVDEEVSVLHEETTSTIYNITMWDSSCNSYNVLGSIGVSETFSQGSAITLNYWTSLALGNGNSFGRSPNPPYLLGYWFEWGSNDGSIAAFLNEDSDGCYWGGVASQGGAGYSNAIQVSIVGQGYCNWPACSA